MDWTDDEREDYERLKRDEARREKFRRAIWEGYSRHAGEPVGESTGMRSGRRQASKPLTPGSNGRYDSLTVPDVRFLIDCGIDPVGEAPPDTRTMVDGHFRTVSPVPSY